MTARAILRGAAVGMCMLLASCGGDSSSSGRTSTSVSADAAWTTLGNRQAPSEPSRPVTSNGGAEWPDYDPPAPFPKTVAIANQFITMKDGTRLAVNVSLPADASGKAPDQRLPAILIQTGYNKDASNFSAALGGGGDYVVRHGYAQVIVDTRGTGRSEGEWESFGALEQSDSPAVVEWVRRQPWSNGDVGVTGTSLLAITALLTAAQQPSGVKAAFTVVPMGDSYRDIVFNGGELNVGFIPLWLGLVTALGAIDPTIMTDTEEGLQAELEHILGALTHFQVPQVLASTVGDPSSIYDGEFWRIRSPLEKAANITVPTFIIGGAHCIFQRGEPLLYEALKGHVPAKLLIGPWDHVQASAGQGLPVDGVPVFNHIELQWFDQYVKGMSVGAGDLPNVTQYVYGHGHYVTTTDWPHPQAHAERLYLRGNKRLTPEKPASGEPSQNVIQQPLNGLCSQSTAQWTAGLLGVVGFDPPCFSDDSLVELLEVAYDTAPMGDDFYINGPIEADLWLSTTSMDAPVVVRVADVGTDGTPFPLTNGIMQASLRVVDTAKTRYLDGEMIEPWHPFTQASVQPVGSGNVVLVPVEIFPTSALIRKGHRLRISVGASDFPHGLPPLPESLNELPGLLTIRSDAAHPSSLLLPVVPAGSIE